MKSSYDCVVIGGGPAGSSAATIVAEGGFDTLLIEREPMPRFHVGESLMPETYWPLERLGVNERLRSHGWQIKKSVQFVTHRGTESEPFFFGSTTIATPATRGRWNEANSTRCCSIALPKSARTATTTRD